MSKPRLSNLVTIGHRVNNATALIYANKGGIHIVLRVIEFAILIMVSIEQEPISTFQNFVDGTLYV